ncbi:pyridoxamine 5'-phosphate oxidase family protein [Actinacidiphila bryophytorum]|uniref:Putative_PNPOx domain-containing protein n=1 Tax=Actinacidiphila bryophytorum TaxID=1436133 RepID=A0A9W4H061_9ACTN|nr:pyridoxamine 5'-phosphate oxidase family protein [Actinacidiphila bryophytorum]CAG7633957.1 Putative_PNPOx domain-containing protein [Actinacidiphila bryophytorum]
MEEIRTEDELRDVLGVPTPRDAGKVRKALDELDRAWLAAAPFLLVATSGRDGSCDVSPKGDPAGFTLVLDERTIAVPERPGNRRADGFRNILANPHVGLIFLVPGRGDTLRINGRARLVKDADFFDRMTVKGHRPPLALLVDIDEVFYHCPKALMRSALWKPEGWAPDAAPSQARIAKAGHRKDQDLAELEAYYGPGYGLDSLYG